MQCVGLEPTAAGALLPTSPSYSTLRSLALIDLWASFQGVVGLNPRFEPHGEAAACLMNSGSEVQTCKS